MKISRSIINDNYDLVELKELISEYFKNWFFYIFIKLIDIQNDSLSIIK